MTKSSPAPLGAGFVLADGSRRPFVSVTILAYSLSQCVPRFRCHVDLVVRPKCHPEFMELPAPWRLPRCWRCLQLPFRLPWRSSPMIPMRRCESSSSRIRLRQLTGQNEELQYRNRQLEERLRALQGGAQAAPGGPPVVQPNIATAPAPQPGPPPIRQPQIQPAGAAGPADCRAGADYAGGPARLAAGAGPAPWRCLRPQPESQCPGSAAGARRRPAADSRGGPHRRTGRPRGRGTARSRQHRRAAQSARRLAAAGTSSRRGRRR